MSRVLRKLTGRAEIVFVVNLARVVGVEIYRLLGFRLHAELSIQDYAAVDKLRLRDEFTPFI